MKRKRTNIAVNTRGCSKHTNALYPAILHIPSQESKSSTLLITDAHNQKIEHQTIKWEDFKFPENWVVDLPQSPKVQSITTAQIQEGLAKATLSFPRRSSLDCKRIQEACEATKYHINLDHISCHPSTSTSINTPSVSSSHVDLFELAQLLHVSTLKVNVLPTKQ